MGGIFSRRFTSCSALVCGLAAHLRLFDRFFQLLDLVDLAVALAELLLDDLHLLVEVIFLLGLLHLLADLALDLLLDIHDLDLAVDELDQLLDPVRRVADVEDRLLVGYLHLHMRRDHVRQGATGRRCSPPR